MNILGKLLDIGRLQPNLKPLQFSDLATAKITDHLNKYTESIFKIKVEYKEKRYLVHVGFDKKKEILTQFSYPVPVDISPKDELFLRGFFIEFHSNDNAFFVYPNIQIEAYDTPKLNIKKFFVNRFIVSPNSDISEIILERNMEDEKHPYFVKRLFSFSFILSFFAKDNWIQIEFDKKDKIQDKEKEVGEWLAEYFETCGYPLLYKNQTLGVEFYPSAP